MIKKAFSIILIFTLLFLTACNEIEIVELNERLIIEAIGIDFEDGRYKVTIEGLDSFTAGSESSSISAPSLTKCYLFEGETIGMAMNSISVITGQIPLFSQARILILGLGTAKEKLSEVLDFFRREYTTRTDILLAVAKNKASDVVSADFGQNVSAGNVLQAAVQSYRHTGRSTKTPLYRFLNSVMGETDSAYCPLVDIKDNAYGKGKEVLLSGTVIFAKDGEARIISPESTFALMLLNNKTENGDITVTTEKGTATIEIIDSNTKTSVEIRDNKAVFHFSLMLRCDIPEFQSEHFKGLSKSDTELIAQSTAQKVTEHICNVLYETLYENNLDIFSFGRRINLEDHNFYNTLLNDNIPLKDVIECEIITEAEIRRIGKIILDVE